MKVPIYSGLFFYPVSLLSIRITLKKPIYFDYAATTPVHPDVLQAMLPYFSEEFGNPGSSQHYYGWVAEEAVESSRTKISSYFGLKPYQVLFTSGATESNNLAILGYLKDKQPGHLITSLIEHKAVLQVFQALELKGWSVTYLKPNEIGIIDVEAFARAIRVDTLLVSLMMINNETGNVTDFKSIAHICKQKGICFHSDATQAIGKLDLYRCVDLPDLVSFSGHKIYGPKGIGVLLVTSSINLHAISLGGGQERGLRPGTLPVQQIVGLAACFDLIPSLRMAEQQIKMYKEKILQELLGDYVLNSAENQSVPHIVSISVPHVYWEDLYRKLTTIAVSNGSACNAKSQLPSHVLLAHGHSSDLALSTVRISLSYLTKETDIDFLITTLNQQVFNL
jgi:cysteine desulfurase